MGKNIYSNCITSQATDFSMPFQCKFSSKLCPSKIKKEIKKENRASLVPVIKPCFDICVIVEVFPKEVFRRL